MKTIKVTGKANLKVVPDQTKVSLTIKGFAKDYSEALAQSARDIKVIKDTISACGINRESLKTENFYVYEKTKTVKDIHGNNIEKQLGYDVTHYMNFKFDNNNELLGLVLAELSKLSINPRIQIGFTVKDQELYKAQMIELAVKDAKRKANVMANSAEVSLGEILQMDYSYQTINFDTDTYLSMDGVTVARDVQSFDIDLTPEDMNLTDTITIT